VHEVFFEGANLVYKSRSTKFLFFLKKNEKKNQKTCTVEIFVIPLRRFKEEQATHGHKW
jgi:hypothetical protein